MDIIIVSGLSGAGKSRTAAVLEDLGYYCVDNIPVSMMPKFVELCLDTSGRYEHVALVSDVRAITDFRELFIALDDIQDLGCKYSILFLEAKTETIVKRYKETRRKHPLDPDGHDLLGAVTKEREYMAPIKDRADHVIDTTNLTLGKLQRTLYQYFVETTSDSPMTVTCMSFGYKNGVPIEADLVFDVRFLPNPFYVPELKNHTGLDKDVSDYIFKHDVTLTFTEKITDLMKFLLPQYIEEGKHNLVVAFGCTGGHHRSVALAAKIGETIANMGYAVEYRHRDIEE
ncbi:MAG: RNase adapter RapZ [Oscillospiraceae bacterium]|nr:RNase adapter RapZ [Oscillospiraceae bacterium]